VPRDATSPPLSRRKRPAHGVRIPTFGPTIVFVTVCTADRAPWLADEGVHALLRDVWSEARAWLVGRYVLMPEHLHLFAAPGDLPVSLDNWVRYWKSQFSQQHQNGEHRWQVDHWDTRLRSNESYDAKWKYVRDNPVRRGLVRVAEEWPFQGEINRLAWW